DISHQWKRIEVGVLSSRIGPSGLRGLLKGSSGSVEGPIGPPPPPPVSTPVCDTLLLSNLPAPNATDVVATAKAKEAAAKTVGNFITQSFVFTKYFLLVLNGNWKKAAEDCGRSLARQSGFIRSLPLSA